MSTAIRSAVGPDGEGLGEGAAAEAEGAGLELGGIDEGAGALEAGAEGDAVANGDALGIAGAELDVAASAEGVVTAAAGAVDGEAAGRSIPPRATTKPNDTLAESASRTSDAAIPRGMPTGAGQRRGEGAGASARR